MIPFAKSVHKQVAHHGSCLAAREHVSHYRNSALSHPRFHNVCPSDLRDSIGRGARLGGRVSAQIKSTSKNEYLRSYVSYSGEHNLHKLTHNVHSVPYSSLAKTLANRFKLQKRRSLNCVFSYFACLNRPMEHTTRDIRYMMEYSISFRWFEIISWFSNLNLVCECHRRRLHFVSYIIFRDFTPSNLC